MEVAAPSTSLPPDPSLSQIERAKQNRARAIMTWQSRNSIDARRVRLLNNERVDPQGRYVLYWLQAAHRTEWNYALEFSAQEANRLGIPLVVLFALTPAYPESSERHYGFMLEGLQDIPSQVAARGGVFVSCLHPSPPEAAVQASQGAAAVVVDCAYLRLLRQWRAQLGSQCRCRVYEVEGEAVVPVGLASGREEPAAATLRPKIFRYLDSMLAPVSPTPLIEKRTSADGLGIPLVGQPIDLSLGPDAILPLLGPHLDRSVPRVTILYRGGTAEANRRLESFLQRITSYGNRDVRQDPSQDSTSGLSPYLQWGQISPCYIATRVRQRVAELMAAARGPREEAAIKEAEDRYLDELIVRRELGMNLVLYNPRYDTFDVLPTWAQDTLLAHASDTRERIYTEADLEAGRTSDRFWNASQLQMVREGKMTPYLRMYWAKRIIAWVQDPREAYRIALRLNNKFELDGRGPGAYIGVAWCFGLHDREFPENPIFGAVRMMNSSGLERRLGRGLRVYTDKFCGPLVGPRGDGVDGPRGRSSQAAATASGLQQKTLLTFARPADPLPLSQAGTPGSAGEASGGAGPGGSGGSRLGSQSQSTAAGPASTKSKPKGPLHALFSAAAARRAPADLSVSASQQAEDPDPDGRQGDGGPGGAGAAGARARAECTVDDGGGEGGDGDADLAGRATKRAKG